MRNPRSLMTDTPRAVTRSYCRRHKALGCARKSERSTNLPDVCAPRPETTTVSMWTSCEYCIVYGDGESSLVPSARGRADAGAIRLTFQMRPEKPRFSTSCPRHTKKSPSPHRCGNPRSTFDTSSSAAIWALGMVKSRAPTTSSSCSRERTANMGAVTPDRPATQLMATCAREERCKHSAGRGQKRGDRQAKGKGCIVQSADRGQF